MLLNERLLSHRPSQLCKKHKARPSRCYAAHARLGSSGSNENKTFSHGRRTVRGVVGLVVFSPIAIFALTGCRSLTRYYAQLLSPIAQKRLRLKTRYRSY